jgi:ABC-type multidrug transport system ATPase subunit
MLLSHGAFYALVVVVVVVGVQTVLGAYSLGHFIESPDFVTTTLSPIIVLCTMVFYTVVWTALVSTVGFTHEFAPYALILTVVGGVALPPFLIMSAFSFVIHLSSYGLNYPSDPSVYLGWSTSCPYSSSNTCFGVLPVIFSACISIGLSILFLSGFVSKLRLVISPPKVVQSNDNEMTEISEVKLEEDRVMSRDVSTASSLSAKKTAPVINGEEWLSDEEQQSQNRSEDTVLIRGLRKEFPSTSGDPPKVAVHNMWLGIRKGECFGLLGHNGAGKTSLIGMLTGMLEPTKGDAFVDGYSVRTQLSEVLQNTGFCPQFGGNWPSMTLREHLEMYAGLRGFDIDADKALLDEIEEGLAVQEHSEKLVSELSGGNRRKLSAALALIGGPHIVYLDEPSTGVDAATRRHLWEFIAGNQAGRATVLTTHSMEEADILAGRIGIMVGGRLRALGTPQELKSKHGSEWQLDLKLKTESTENAAIILEQTNDQHVENIASFLSEHLPGVRLTESFADSVRFLVPAGSVAGASGVGLGATFNLIELNKAELGIEEFSLSQTTLENVFLNVAKEDEERPVTS